MKDKMKSQEGVTPELKKLNVQGDIYYTTFTRKYEMRQPWIKPDHKEVLSFIPGTVREISVKEGDNVNSEQKLLV
jgi:biotin carboxyl carrier protein